MAKRITKALFMRRVRAALKKQGDMPPEDRFKAWVDEYYEEFKDEPRHLDMRYAPSACVGDMLMDYVLEHRSHISTHVVHVGNRAVRIDLDCIQKTWSYTDQEIAQVATPKFTKRVDRIAQALLLGSTG